MPKRRYGIVAISLLLVGMFCAMIMAPTQLGGPSSVSANWTESTYVSHLDAVRFYDSSHAMIGYLSHKDGTDTLYLAAGTIIHYVQFDMTIYPGEVSTPTTWKTCVNIDMSFEKSSGKVYWWSGWTEVMYQQDPDLPYLYHYCLQSVDMNVPIEASFSHTFTATLQILVN